jgi:hypothetical protein
MDVVWNECWKLSNAIIVSNELAEGVSSLMQYSEAERLQLAEQFAQATGVFMACVLVAEEKNMGATVVEMYKSYQHVFTQYGHQAGKLSGEFTTENGLVEYLEGLASLTIEQLDFYRIEPTRLYDAAMQAVEDHKEENTETNPWGVSTTKH